VFFESNIAQSVEQYSDALFSYSSLHHLQFFIN